MRVALQADSGRTPHVPVGRALASATFRPADRGFFPLVRFAKPAHVVAGRLYHVVFSNVDPDPARNYVSINALYSASRLGRGPAVPDGLAVLETHRGGRRSALEPSPLAPARVLPADPRRRRRRRGPARRARLHGGLGSQADRRRRDGAPAAARAGWPDDPRRRRVAARAPPATRPAISLVLRLERPDGRVLASASVAPGEVPTGDAGLGARALRQARVAGPRYRFRADGVGDGRASYEAFPIRKGTGFGFDPRTYFDDGYAQFNDGGGWVGWDQWGGHDRRDSDLQFALDVSAVDELEGADTATARARRASRRGEALLGLAVACRGGGRGGDGRADRAWRSRSPCRPWPSSCASRSRCWRCTW